MNEQSGVADIVEALGLSPSGELVAIVGGGGKSSLMFALAERLPGRGVMTTTTRIFSEQLSGAAAVCTLEDADWRARLDAFESALLVVGRVEGERAVGVPPELPAEMLAHPRVDWVVVEADGSRMLPVKAPAPHEPVIPVGTTLLVSVVGIDALLKPIGEIAHRPERVSAIAGLSVEDILTPAALAHLITSPEGGLKGAASAGRTAVLINKVESASEFALAREVAGRILRDAAVERVAMGALLGAEGAGWVVSSR
ncbi:MAG: selenium cofactor biosynthesis protein YqeC [Myxococcota bacterium]